MGKQVKDLKMKLAVVSAFKQVLDSLKKFVDNHEAYLLKHFDGKDEKDKKVEQEYEANRFLYLYMCLDTLWLAFIRKTKCSYIENYKNGDRPTIFAILDDPKIKNTYKDGKWEDIDK